MGLKYDREKFISAKAIILYAANILAVANTTFNQAKGTGLKDCSNDSGGLVAFTGEPEITASVENSTIENLKKDISSAYEAVHDFNAKMDEMVSIISEKVDPDLAEEIKKLEKEALKDYLNIGLAGGVLDTLQIYELIEKYKDDPTLELDENQKTLLDFLAKEAEKTIEYNNMNGWEKFWTGAEVFIVSVVDGVIQVGEMVVDGAITLGGGAISLGVYVFGGDEARDDFLDGVAKVVDFDAAGKAYDAYVDARGLNDIIAYGGVHQIGLAGGKVVGETLLTMIPGGKAAQIAVQACKSAGKSMDKSKNLAENRTDLTEDEIRARRFGAAYGSAAVSAGSTMATNAVVDAAKAEVSAAPFEYSLGKYQAAMSGTRVAKIGGNAYFDYLASGSTGGYGQYVSDHAGDYATELIGGALGDKFRLEAEAGKIVGVNSDYNWYKKAQTYQKNFDRQYKPIGKQVLNTATEHHNTRIENYEDFLTDDMHVRVNEGAFNPNAVSSLGGSGASTATTGARTISKAGVYDLSKIGVDIRTQ